MYSNFIEKNIFQNFCAYIELEESPSTFTTFLSLTPPPASQAWDNQLSALTKIVL